MSDLTTSAAWQNLTQLQKPKKLAELFATDPTRSERYRITAAGMTLDYSRQPIDDTVLKALQNLATQEDITGWRDKLFAGDKINNTEDRAVLHWQWREASPPADIAETIDRMNSVATAIRNGSWRGATGKAIRHIVNIGIGGSDLGPRLIYDALSPTAPDGPQLHFVSNVDSCDLARVIARCPAEETLFVIVSKSMQTLETKLNAEAACRWLQQELGAETALGPHLLAVTTNLEAAAALGIPADHCFGFGSAIGGRYSIWSPVGLAVMIAVGPDKFADFRAGAAAMDEHFRQTAPADNMAVILALLSLWQVNFQGAQAEAVLPYSTRLHLLPSYLQQLVMESNGKGVTRSGEPVHYATAPVIFGSAGTLGQHSFHQLLHQGTLSIPADFIIVREATDSLTIGGEAYDQVFQQWLIANGLAQSAALLYGHADQDPHRAHPGDRPSNLLLLERLTPATLGALIALYEYKTFIQGILWRINSFDQYGVELGKKMATSTHAALNKTGPAPNSATAALLRQPPLS